MTQDIRRNLLETSNVDTLDLRELIAHQRRELTERTVWHWKVRHAASKLAYVCRGNYVFSARPIYVVERVCSLGSAVVIDLSSVYAHRPPTRLLRS